MPARPGWRWSTPPRADPDGPWLVRLADVAQPELVTTAVAGALGLAEAAGEPRETLVTALRARGGLLVLDNCEHLVAPVADLVLELLEWCAGLRVLATSREPLGVDGEHILPVTPLPVDAAVELLVDRVGAIRPGWVPSAEERRQAQHLATALDGIPLALELAAARARVLGLRELVEHLDDRFAVLGAVPRGSLAPHTTLDAALAWSVDLLSPADRALLLRLWPFEGGFALEAAEALRPAGAGPAALEALSSLVVRSVVVADTTVTPSRYRLLETVRAYCRARDPDPGATRAAHAAWVRTLVARSAQELRGERSAHAIRVLARELPNLRAGIAHDMASAPAAALRTAGLLEWFWYRGGRLAEGRRLLDAALTAAPDAPGVDRARAWASYGTLCYLGGDLPDAARALQRAAETLGMPSDLEGRILRGQISYYEAMMRATLGDPDAAHRAAVDAVRIGHEVGQEWIIACGEMALGGALVTHGRIAEGREILATAAQRGLRCGQVWAAGMSELVLARSMLGDGQPAAGALPVLRRSLARFRQEDDLSNILTVLHTGALALALAGQPERGARLRAAVRRHAVRHGLRPEQIDAPGAAALDAALRRAVDPTVLTAAEAAGALLDWDAMVGLLADRDTVAGAPTGA